MANRQNNNTGQEQSPRITALFRDLRSQVEHASTQPPNAPAPKRIDEKIRKLQIANDIAENDQKLKRRTLNLLFIFLALETVAVFVLAFFQGFKTGGFALESWSFRLVVTVTIGQITAMLLIAVQHLFPHKENKN
jgi:hypothetical protein